MSGFLIAFGLFGLLNCGAFAMLERYWSGWSRDDGIHAELLSVSVCSGSLVIAASVWRYLL